MTLVEAARQAGWAAALAAEAAAQDLPKVDQGGALDVPAWLTLPPARRRNALQAWLAVVLAAPVPNSLVQRLNDELPLRRSGSWPAPGSELRLHRGRLSRHESLPESPEPASVSQAALTLDLNTPGCSAVPGWSGHFEVLAVVAGGVAASLLRQVKVGPRRGDERFRLTPRGMARSVKKQCQAAGVPAWERRGPLLWLPDGRLLYVPGLGIDASLQAAAGQPQVALRWVADKVGVPGPRLSRPSRQLPG